MAPQITIERHDYRELQEIADLICNSNQILVVTGAGISTNTGIPDFRSQNGLYNLVKSRYPNYSTLVKGKDLFDSILFTDPNLTSIFFSFLSELRQKVNSIGDTTATHKFIKNLADTERLLRCYTQNIDGLESRDGLCMDVTKGVGKRGKGKDRVGKEIGCEVVQLHGDLEQLRCTLCGLLVDYTVERLEILSSGEPPDCPECSTKANDRLTAGKRSITVGTLRPNIVLYNEPHPKGELIGKLTHHDATRANPDLMVVIGTSLKVVGLKRIVKAFAAKVHDKGGKVLYINNVRAPDSVWGNIIDYHVEMDCDEWVRDLKVRRKEIWEKAQRRAGRRKTMNGNDSDDKENRTGKDLNRRKSMPAAAQRSKSDMGSHHLLTPKKSPLQTVSAPSTSKRRLLDEMNLYMTPSKRQRLDANGPSSSYSVIKLQGNGNVVIYDESKNCSPSSSFTEPPTDLLTPTPKKKFLHSVQIGTNMTPRRFLQCVSVPTTPSRKDSLSADTPSKKSTSEWVDIDDELSVLCSPSKNGTPRKGNTSTTQTPRKRDATPKINGNSPSKSVNLTPRRLAMGFPCGDKTPVSQTPRKGNLSPTKTPGRLSVHNTPRTRDSRGFRIGSRTQEGTASRNRIIRCSVSPPPKPQFSSDSDVEVASRTDKQLPTPPTSQPTPTKPAHNFEVQITSPKKIATPRSCKSAVSDDSSETGSLTLDQRQLQEEMRQSVEPSSILGSSRPSTAVSKIGEKCNHVRNASDLISPVNFYAPAPPKPTIKKKTSRNSLPATLPPLSIKTRHGAKEEKRLEEWNKPGAKTRARRRTFGSPVKPLAA